MLDTAKTLLFRGSDELSIDDQGGGRIAMPGVESEDDHNLAPEYAAAIGRKIMRPEGLADGWRRHFPKKDGDSITMNLSAKDKVPSDVNRLTLSIAGLLQLREQWCPMHFLLKSSSSPLSDPS